MPLDTVLAVTALAFATTWMPWPNNLMLAASGATFGYRATLAHAFGVALGFPPMLFVLAMGLGEAFRASTPLREAAVCAGIFPVSGLTSAHGWAAFGATLRRLLATDLRLHLFNGTMGALIAASAFYLAVAEI